MEASIQLLFAIVFFILGLSHLLQPMAWLCFFKMLEQKGEAGVLAIALLTMPPGLLIAVYHPVWTGIPLVLSLIGWGYLIKSSLYLVFPALGLRVLSRLSEANAGKFCWVGLVMTFFGALLAWELW